jgi:hypothetical protein
VSHEDDDADRSYLVGRIYTRRLLRGYVLSAESLARYVVDVLGIGTAGSYLVCNPFADSTELPLTSEVGRTFLKELRNGQVESFSCFRRVPGTAVGFDFVLRVETVPFRLIYYKHNPRSRTDAGGPLSRPARAWKGGAPCG